MTEHSLLGASSAHRWLNCPGSFKLSQTAPHRPSSIYAATGTLAHEYIERAVHNRSFACDESDLGREVLQDGIMVPVSRALIDGANIMLDYLLNVVALSDWADVEFRVDLADYFPVPPPVPVFGTIDAAAHTWATETLEVIDYKNGAGVAVTVTENPQLLFYAAGVLHRLPTAQRDRVRTIKLTIVQPNAGSAPIRSWELDVVDLLMWVDEVLVPGVDACTRDDAPLNPGAWCRFCPVSHACPRLMADAVEMAKMEFDDIPGDPGELARALETAERAELWIARIREFATDQLQRQVRIPGWGLVPTRPTRKWLYPDTDVASRLAVLGAVHDDVWETRIRSPAQIERQLSRTRGGRRIWSEAATMVEARSSGLKLGRDGTTDPREDFTDE